MDRPCILHYIRILQRDLEHGKRHQHRMILDTDLHIFVVHMRAKLDTRH